MADNAATTKPSAAVDKGASPAKDKASSPAKTGAPEQGAGAGPMEAQHQQPGVEAEMKGDAKPIVIREDYKGSGKLDGKISFLTGGDSGIGRSVAVHFAREGADVAFMYLSDAEDADAQETEAMVKAEGRRCLVFKGDAADPSALADALSKTVQALGSIDVVVGNAAEQHQRADEWPNIDAEGVRRVLRTNAEGYLFLAQEAVKAGAFKGGPSGKGGGGGAIIFTSSVLAFAGSGSLIDYSGTKGFEVTLARSLARLLAKDNVRVNCVAPGPVITPLIPATFSAEQLKGWSDGGQLMGRPAQPCEIAAAYVLLASRDGSYITGSTIHVNGGQYMA
jgi:NAD(P)-dependent dehydrogenase (short-subunit alcohol dehydrogenase family)